MKSVGKVGTMPGTSGFTMACFPAADVPVDTELFVATKVEIDHRKDLLAVLSAAPVDHDGTPFELLPSDLRTHLGDFREAVRIAHSVSNIDSNEESYWQKQLDCIDRIEAQINAAKPGPPVMNCPVQRENVLKRAIAPLVAIADAYDASNLDEARPEWTKPDGVTPEQIELYSGRGGKRLLTLADCFRAREVVR